MNPRRPPFFSNDHKSWVIPLTQGVLCLVDEDIAATFGTQNWCASQCGQRWYAVQSPTRPERAKGTRAKLLHRLIIAVEDGVDVDHVIHFPPEARLIDNRRANLRICSRQQNIANARKWLSPRSSPFKGVCWFSRTRRWKASIGVNRKSIHLGYFDDPAAAAAAYDKAAREFHGEFAATNKSLGLLPHG